MAQNKTAKKPTPRKPTPRSKVPAAGARASAAEKLHLSSRKRGIFGGSRASSPQKTSRIASSRVATSTSFGTKPSQKTKIFATPTPSERRRQRQAASAPSSDTRRHMPSLKTVALAVMALATLAVVAVIALTVMAHTSAFTITNVVATSTPHVSDKSIVRLAQVEDGATLLNFDAEKIEENIKRNPWIADVKLTRSFPSTLKISVSEYDVRALVIMNGSEVVWCLGTGGVWLEPISVKAQDGDSFKAAVLKQAQEMGALLITDTPTKLNPHAGSQAKSKSLQAALKFEEGFTDELSKQVLSYSAPSDASVSCTLKSGVTVSLGTAEDITAKESVILALLKKYEGKLTYINVRVASNPSYRMIDSDNVGEGTGALGENVPSDSASSDNAPSDNASSDNAASDNVPSDSASSDGMSSSGTASDSASSDSTSSNEAPANQ